MPFISICIPAYKRVIYLKKLLDSISVQNFKDFEVIITDDSSDNTVENFVRQYFKKFNLIYIKNDKSLGTPANWNNAIKHANGEWIKLMHDDDWFIDENTLQQFANAATLDSKFIISAYNNFFLKNQQTNTVKANQTEILRLHTHPHKLFASNIIGPPSVTMVHRSITEHYEERMKWLVDIDFYIRVLQKNQINYIPRPLINVGIGEEQVTQVSFLNPLVELPELLLLFEKYGTAPAKNIWVYDAWWRLMRNLKLRNIEQLEIYTPGKKWPQFIKNMILHQQKIPLPVLKTGAFSKSFMLLSYMINRSNL